MLNSTSSSTLAITIDSRRRNGQKLSCENCRKSKLACDHTLPVCGRCIRRKCREPCVYHPAPMTKLDTAKRASRERPPPAKRHLPSPSISTPRSTDALNLETHEDSSRERSLDVCRTAAVGIPDLGAQNGSLHTSEFLGSTNYRAILDEYQIELQPQSAGTGNSKTTMPWRRSETLSLAKTALLKLPRRDTCHSLIDRSLEYPDLGSHLPSLRSLNETFWKSFGASLAEPRKPHGLSAMIDTLSVNTINGKSNEYETSAAWFQAPTVNSESKFQTFVPLQSQHYNSDLTLDFIFVHST